jgi:hypothetical protein
MPLSNCPIVSLQVVFEYPLNYEVGVEALRIAANTDYKKAILMAYDTKNKINDLLDLRCVCPVFMPRTVEIGPLLWYHR